MSLLTFPLPPHIHTILITGAGGYVGQQVAALLLASYKDVKVVLADLRVPEAVKGFEGRCECLKGDLSVKKEVEGLFEGKEVDAIIAFQGIMSGESEKKFELCYKVNVESHLRLMEVARVESGKRKDGRKIVYVYTSGLAVYGGEKCRPEAFVDPETTPLLPESSYGTAKAITELYLNDYTRKGYLDGRILRLPTVAIRAGAPSSAVSSFISGLIREPLQGIPSICPVATSFDDPSMTTIPLYLSRSYTVFKNIIYSLTIPAEKFPKESRTVNVPGITITPKQILEALSAVGGQKALDLVTYESDPAVLAIIKTWPGAFDNTYAISLGFEQDDPETGFMEAVKDFKKGLKA